MQKDGKAEVIIFEIECKYICENACKCTCK